MAGKRTRLTDAAIARLRPREREYTVWDSRAPGLGVRVRPTGGKSYLMLHDAGGGSRRASLGPVAAMGIAGARRECLARQAAGVPDGNAAPAHVIPAFREFVEGEWKRTHFERYKPSTKKGIRSLLAARLLPAFGASPLDRIAPTRVRRWFADFSRTAPGNANHALSLLRQIMNFAIARGHIEKNPTQAIRPNRRPPLTRFLSREEIARLHRVLDRQTRNGCREQADIVRLLLLTGCRKSEIVCLRWSEVRDGALLLADGKTGPRTVPLNSPARRIVDRQPRCGSEFVFPSPLDHARPRHADLRIWYRIRREAGIEDVRLHDLRHTFASQAVMNNIPVPIVSRLLGHSNVRMTLRYAHLADRDIEAAAERIGVAMAKIMAEKVPVATMRELSSHDFASLPDNDRIGEDTDEEMECVPSF